MTVIDPPSAIRATVKCVEILMETPTSDRRRSFPHVGSVAIGTLATLPRVHGSFGSPGRGTVRFAGQLSVDPCPVNAQATGRIGDIAIRFLEGALNEKVFGIHEVERQ